MAEDIKIFSDKRIRKILTMLDEMDKYVSNVDARVGEDFDESLNRCNEVSAGTVGLALGGFACVRADIKDLREMIYRDFSETEDRTERPTVLVGPSE